MKRAKLFFILSLFISSQINAQLVDILGGPTVTVPCAQPCKMVYANFVKPLRTNTYQSVPIVFNPLSLSSPTTLSLQDDKFSGAVPIGFDFCFYNNVYSTVYISANGHITFNPAYGSGNCSFDTKQGLPFYNATYPDNGIFCPFSDGNTTVGGTIKYATLGVAPNRKFVVSYENIPFFGSGSACTGSPATFQCVLNEISNSIEIFITNKSNCNNDTLNWLNYATMGIQNIGGSAFHVVNNRNASIWTANNEGWRINPAGPPAYSMRWYSNNVLFANNVDSVNVCDPFPKRLRAELTLDCPYQVLIDTQTLIKNNPLIDSVTFTKTTCLNTNDGTATIYASGGTPPYSYSTSNGPLSTNNTLGSLAYGQHTLFVTDANGCTSATTIFIGTSSTLQAKIDSVKLPICPLNNGFILGSASGGTPPYTYIWNPGSITTQNIYNIGPGYYTLEVTDAQGCKNQKGYSIIWDSLPKAEVSAIKPVCGDSTGSINVNVTQGNAPFTFSWSNSATSQNLTNLFSGSYTLTITDANGCLDSFTVALLDTLNLQLQMTGFGHTTCGLNNGLGSGLASNGLPPYSYLWSNSATTPVTNTLASGWQYLTITDSNGCSRTDSLNLNPSTPVTINFLHTNAYCDEDNGVLIAQAVNNSGGVTYAWNTNDSTSQIDSLAAGLYIVTVTDSVGCIGVDSFNLVNEGKPVLQVLDYIKPFCFGDSTGRLLLGGTGGTAPYKYSFDGVNFTTVALVTNFAAGTYKIYIRDANSCLSDTTIFFDPPDDILVLHSNIDTLDCFWDTTDSISFTAQLGTTPYDWSLNGTNYSAQNTYSGFGVGANTIFVRDAKGCKKTFEFIVPGPPSALEILADIENVPCYNETGGELDAQIIGGWLPYTYAWSPAAGQILTRTDLYAGNYILTVSDDRNCSIDSNFIVPQNYCCDCYFPNAFTPNGDGKNDVFRAISPASDIERFELVVYNRWGVVVFKTNQVSGAWDGTLHGEAAQIGSYFFKCRLKCLNKEDDVFLKGDVTLLR